MSRIRNVSRVTAALGLLALAAAGPLHAHGTMEIPISRVYNCYLENPESPKSAACKAAVAAGGTQALYDWNGINRLDANGQHRAVIPDGKLCSAGKTAFQGLDLPRADWPTKAIAPDANGNFEFVFLATAPHATKVVEFYVTREGYDPTRPLKWSDLEASPFATFAKVPLVNGRYRYVARLPQGKTGPHVILSIWQRADSTEAFYSCSDVRFGPAAPPTAWKDIGVLRAPNALAAGSTVTFRLFDAQGGNAFASTVTVAAGDTAASAWPLRVATAVNAQTSLARIGVLQPDGTIVPQASATQNTVYAAGSGTLTFAVDIEPPAPGGPDGGSGGTQPLYPSGIGSYQAGSVVKGADGGTYQCKPFPYAGWCNQAPAYYAPGTGLAWNDAWTLLP